MDKVDCPSIDLHARRPRPIAGGTAVEVQMQEDVMTAGTGLRVYPEPAEVFVLRAKQ